ncbi:MAG: RNA methyltransferase [Candidatus Hydrogenedentes bacterium]|nr:RNA methyltransferase [Candidatus Hydrogenedentota bacterium]
MDEFLQYKREPVPYTPQEPYYLGLNIDELPPIRRNPIYIILDNLRSAYNVGSIFRTGDAGAVEHIYLCGMSAHPPHRKIEKTALGAHEYVPWSYFERTKDCVMLLKSKGIPVVAIEITQSSKSLFDYTWQKPIAIVLGNEVVGVQEKVLKIVDDVVRIPMFGYKNTINVATTFGIILYDILRKWNDPTFQNR